MNKDPQPYSSEEESSKSSTISESALALEEQETFVLPDDVDYATGEQSFYTSRSALLLFDGVHHYLSI